MKRTLLTLAGSTTLLFLGLLALRQQLVASLGVDALTAWQIGVGRGVLQDLAVAMVPGMLAALVAASTRFGYGLPWALLAAITWGFGVANLTFFRYFGAPLEAWNIAEHTSDVWTIRHVVRDMLSIWTALPMALLVMAGVWALRRARRPAPDARRVWRRAGAALALAAVLVAGVAVWRAPDELLAGSAVGENALFELVRDAAAGGSPQAALHDELRRFGLSDVLRRSERFAEAPTAHLAALRDWRRGLGAPLPRAQPGAGDPLLRRLPASRERTRTARLRLGLPADTPPNVIVLYLESVRAFEVQHPVIGPAVFPELHRVWSRHAIRFPTTYSSAMAAGLTARGQFSTGCSMLPNFGAAATFISHPEVRVRCMADLASDAGYETLWISGGPMHFHNKFVFERLHGVEHFYDEDHFQQVPVAAKPYEGCGFPDKDLLERSIALLEEAPTPFFASILTISTHVPHTQVPEAPVPASLREWFAAEGDGLGSDAGVKYAAYLSRLRYLDQGIGLFFDRFFASDLAKDTLVVVLGDHGIAMETPLPATPVQRIEQRARIPMALVSAGLAGDEVLTHPVHQVDIAPTVAEVAGWEGDVTWVGRPMLGDGTPWVFFSRAEFHYRLGDRACYAEPGSSRRCYALGEGVDPLFDPPGYAESARKPHDAFFLGLALETRHAITRNQLVLHAVR